MARILVVYGTTEGHTAKVAGAVSETLHRSGAEVDVRAAGDLAPAPDGYDAVIVAASVHAGRYQRSVRRWARTHADALAHKPAAFISVSLGVLQHDAKVVKFVAGALPYTKYGWLRRLVMKRIVAKAGGDTDTRRDYEYTDWNDLRHFADDFGRSRLQPLEPGRASLK